MVTNDEIKTKIMPPKNFCEMEAVRFIASRYGTTPEKVLERYFAQSGIVSAAEDTAPEYTLAPNEMALFHDLGIQPTTEVI